MDPQEEPAPFSPVVVAAGMGALWGLAGYALLWGYTPVVVHRRFVASALGTLALLPVRAVLWAIRLVEDHVVGHPFDFSRNNLWIGAAGGLVGAVVGALGFVVARLAVRRLRRASV